MATFSKHGKRIGRPPKQTDLDPIQRQEAAIARAAKTFLNRYDAAGRGRRLAGWTPPSTGPNLAMAGVQVLKDRTRDSIRNDWAARSSSQKWGTTLIGIGITPRFKRITSSKRRQELNDLWADWGAVADADGVLDIYGLQTLVVKSWVDGGECFARRRPRFEDEGFPVPVQIQLLESDMVPMLDSDQRVGLPVGHTIRSGIEFNKRGRRIAYWVYKNHPGDQAGVMNLDGEDLVRVLASEMTHIFEPERPGQIRGVSLLAPILARLRNTADYEDTTLERQKIANLFVGFISRSLPNFDPNDPNIDAMTGAAFDMAPGETAPLVPLKPGLFQELEDGQEVKFSDPPEAGTTYSDYMRTSHLGTAAGAGLPYEFMSGDIQNVSDRTLRVVVNEFRRLAEQRQWQMVIPQFCQKTIAWFVEAAVLVGKVMLDEADDVRRVEHAPHGWAHIHPVQDPTGKRIELEMGTLSRSSVISSRGDDPESVDEERAADMEREKKLGLWIEPEDGVNEDDTDDVPNQEYVPAQSPKAREQRERRLANRARRA